MVARPWTLYGAFELDKHSPLSWKQLFRDATKKRPGLSDAPGVYIIGSKLKSKVRIHYVGMTYYQGFETEVFSQRNIPFIWDPLLEIKSSKVKIWLIAKKNASGKGYCWDARLERQAFLLETLLIMHAKAAGHRLMNTSKMKSADGIAVAGLFGSAKRGKPAAGLSELVDALAI